MTSEELIAVLLTEDGLAFTVDHLKNNPNATHFNVHLLYSNLVSVLRSFTEEIKEQSFFSLQNAIQEQREVEMTTCVCKDDVDFIVNALDVMYLKGDKVAQLILKGLSTSDYTPFEVYTFFKFNGDNYYLGSIQQLNYKLLHDKAFSPWGAWLATFEVGGNAMINPKLKYPRFEGMRGECKQQRSSIQVYVDKRGKEDE